MRPNSMQTPPYENKTLHRKCCDGYASVLAFSLCELKLDLGKSLSSFLELMLYKL